MIPNLGRTLVTSSDVLKKSVQAGGGMSLFGSLSQVLERLTTPELVSLPVVQRVLSLSKDRGIIVEDGGKYQSDVLSGVAKDPSVPFVVIEGLDGSGKTFLTNFLHQYYDMILMQTPPKVFKESRSFFDAQPEPVKRAFYSLGNYYAAEEVLNTCKPVIMDRFWHSTAAYAVANDLRSGEHKLNGSSLKWPEDLLQPNLVIFLVVSEAERIRRHSSRQQFTNTNEEQALAKDESFRQNVIKFYRSIKGPEFVELSADGTKEEVKEKVLQCIQERFSDFASRKVSSDLLDSSTMK